MRTEDDEHRREATCREQHAAVAAERRVLQGLADLPVVDGCDLIVPTSILDQVAIALQLLLLIVGEHGRAQIVHVGSVGQHDGDARGRAFDLLVAGRRFLWRHGLIGLVVVDEILCGVGRRKERTIGERYDDVVVGAALLDLCAVVLLVIQLGLCLVNGRDHTGLAFGLARNELHPVVEIRMIDRAVLRFFRCKGMLGRLDDVLHVVEREDRIGKVGVLPHRLDEHGGCLLAGTPDKSSHAHPIVERCALPAVRWAHDDRDEVLEVVVDRLVEIVRQVPEISRLRVL